MELQTYITHLQERNLSPNTIINYPVSIKQYGSQLFNTPNLQEHVRRMLKKHEVASVQTKLAALKSYARFKRWKADWKKIIQLIPTVQRKFFTTLDEIELEQLKAVKFEKREQIWQRNNLILDFLFYTGIRVSELVNLKHSDYQDRSLKISGKGNKIRYVFLPPLLVEKINPYSQEYLFTNCQGSKITREYILKLIRQRTFLSGIKKRITPHTFRRSFATLLNKKGAKLTTIQKLLGHAHITTTAHYIHNSYEELYSDYSKLWSHV